MDKVKDMDDISDFSIPPGFEKVHEEWKEDTANGADVLAAEAKSAKLQAAEAKCLARKAEEARVAGEADEESVAKAEPNAQETAPTSTTAFRSTDPRASSSAPNIPTDTWSEAAPPSPPTLRSTAARTTMSVPTIPRHHWTETEITTVNGLLADADWPLFKKDSNIYQHAHKAAYKLISRDSIVYEARVLQLALQVSKQNGHFLRLNRLLKPGLAGMENYIIASYHDNQHRERYYEKTAGDMVQSYWCKKHLSNMSDYFGNNPTQAAIACWLKLPQLVLEQDTAEQIRWWNEHHVADFQEQLTLYLPTKLLTMYMNISINYHRLFVKLDDDIPLCEHRDARGLLCCNKQVQNRYGRFCCSTHNSEARQPFYLRMRGSAALESLCKLAPPANEKLSVGRARGSCEQRVYIIGIAGPSGVGKSSLAHKIATECGSPIVPVCLDWFSRINFMPKFQRGERNRESPDGYDFDRLCETLRRIVDVLATATKVPDHIDIGIDKLKLVHTILSGKVFVKPVIIIVEGSLLFHNAELCKMLDTQLWLEAKYDTCCRRYRRGRKEGQQQCDFEDMYPQKAWVHFYKHSAVQLTNAPGALHLDGTWICLYWE